MKYQGWTLSDLAGELAARGIDMEQIEQWQIEAVLNCPTPEEAAKEMKQQ